MIRLDLETFTDLVVAVQQVKEKNVEVARAVGHIGKHVTEEVPVSDGDWNDLIEKMSEVMTTLSRIECLLNAAFTASQEEASGPI